MRPRCRERIARRELSCVEVMRACLERIERVNPALNAIVSLRDGDALLAEAAERDAELARGERRGWMHGLPHAIKDLEETAGIVTTSGSPLFADFVPAADSEVVRRIRAAGAIVIGKTNVPEFGYGSQTYNDVFGPTRNPYDLTRTAGGSSGGAAAALAAGLVPVADGSDYMGSLRNPAAFCNVYGFRPSLGRVGSPPAERAFEAPIGTAGPMARSPRDLAALLATLAGPHPELPFSIDEDPAGARRAAGARRPGAAADRLARRPRRPPAVRARDPRALRGRAARARRRGRPGRRPASIPPPRGRPPSPCATTTPRGRSSCRASGSSRSSAGRPRARSRSPARRCTRPSATRTGRRRGAAGAAARPRRARAAQRPGVPVRRRAPTGRARSPGGRCRPTTAGWRSSIYASLAGLPVAGVPVGFGPGGLPMGMQLIGRPRGDRALLELTEAYDRATGWVGRVRPPAPLGSPPCPSSSCTPCRPRIPA